MLTRIRNAIHRKQESVDMPASKLKVHLARIFMEEGFIQRYEAIEREGHPTLRIYLKYMGRSQSVINGLQRVSRPGRRLYVGKDGAPKVRGGLAVAVLSTSQGVMTHRESKKRNIGGEILCFIW